MKLFGQAKFVFGQVIIIVTCPNGQVGKKVNVEPWVWRTLVCIKKKMFKKSYGYKAHFSFKHYHDKDFFQLVLINNSLNKEKAHGVEDLY